MLGILHFLFPFLRRWAEEDLHDHSTEDGSLFEELHPIK